MEATLKSKKPSPSGLISRTKLNSSRNPRGNGVEPVDVLLPLTLLLLPNEVQQHILSFVGTYDLLHNCRFVCTRWSHSVLPLCRERQVRLNLEKSGMNIATIQSRFRNATALPWSSLRLHMPGPFLDDTRSSWTSIRLHMPSLFLEVTRPWWPSLRLHMPRSSPFWDSEFLDIASVLKFYGNQIQALGLVNCSTSDKVGMEIFSNFTEVVGHIPNLKSLEVILPPAYYILVDNFDVFVPQLLSRRVPSLSLRIPYFGPMSSGWALLATQATLTLKSLTVRSERSLPPPGYFATLELLLANCQGLVNLKLEGFMSGVAEADAASLPLRILQIPVLPNLKSFQLSWICLGNWQKSTFHFAEITSTVMPHLELVVLDYRGCGPRISGIEPRLSIGDVFQMGQAGPFTTVKTLNVNAYSGTPDQWKQLFPNLANLCFESYETKVADVLKQFPDLKELRIRVRVEVSAYPKTQSLINILPLLPKFKKLTHLCLGNVDEDEDFNKVASRQLPALAFPNKLHLTLLWTKFTDDRALHKLRRRHLSVRVANSEFE